MLIMKQDPGVHVCYFTTLITGVPLNDVVYIPMEQPNGYIQYVFLFTVVQH